MLDHPKNIKHVKVQKFEYSPNDNSESLIIKNLKMPEMTAIKQKPSRNLEKIGPSDRSYSELSKNSNVNEKINFEVFEDNMDEYYSEASPNLTPVHDDKKYTYFDLKDKKYSSGSSNDKFSNKKLEKIFNESEDLSIKQSPLNIDYESPDLNGRRVIISHALTNENFQSYKIKKPFNYSDDE